MRFRRPLGMVLVATAVSAPLTAAADGSDPAMKHFEAGRAHVGRHRCDLAIPEFRASVAARPNVGALLNLAECLEASGDMSQAHVSLLAAEDLATRLDDDRRVFAHDSIARLEAKGVVVAVSTRDGVLEVDGGAVPRERWARLLVSAGTPHRFVLRTQGEPLVVRDVEGRPGETVSLDLAPAAPAVAPPIAVPRERKSSANPLRAAGIVTGAIGGGLVVSGIVSGVLALSVRADLADAVAADTAHCSGQYPHSVCDPSVKPRLDDLERRAFTFGHASTWLIAGGATLVVTGVVLFLVAKPTDTRSPTGAVTRALTTGVVW
jgi:hypothetical protein